MRKTFSLVALGVFTSASSGVVTYWVIENEETAAIAEVFICIVAGLTIVALTSAFTKKM